MAGTGIPDASVYRLSLYHCFLGEMMRAGESGRVTSRMLARELDIREETVRRDLSFVGGVGRPGSGYDTATLFEALQSTLGIRDDYPIVKIGTTQMLQALSVVFPPNSYGVNPVAYFSERPEDEGAQVEGIDVQHVTRIPELDRTLGVSVALVACSQGWVKLTLDLLAQAGIEGVLLLTPALRLEPPEGLTVTQIRMPCDIKSLACRCSRQRVASLP